MKTLLLTTALLLTSCAGFNKKPRVIRINPTPPVVKVEKKEVHKPRAIRYQECVERFLKLDQNSKDAESICLNSLGSLVK